MIKQKDNNDPVMRSHEPPPRLYRSRIRSSGDKEDIQRNKEVTAKLMQKQADDDSE